MEKSCLESVLDENKKQSCATSIKIEVLKRMLTTLHENGHINRTNLAGKTGLNYSNCIKYINLLKLLGWVQVIYDDGHYVAITEKGIDVIERFLNLY